MVGMLGTALQLLRSRAGILAQSLCSFHSITFGIGLKPSLFFNDSIEIQILSYNEFILL